MSPDCLDQADRDLLVRLDERVRHLEMVILEMREEQKKNTKLANWGWAALVTVGALVGVLGKKLLDFF